MADGEGEDQGLVQGVPCGRDLLLCIAGIVVERPKQRWRPEEFPDKQAWPIESGFVF